MSTLLLGYQVGQISQDQVDQIRRLAPDMDLLITDDRSTIEAALEEIEIAARSFPNDLIARAPRLRWMQQWGAGADWLLRHPEAATSDVIVTSASGVHAIQITEHILAFLLAFARQLHLAVRAQANREWRRLRREDVFDGLPLFELSGKVMLLIGVGAIG